MEMFEKMLIYVGALMLTNLCVFVCVGGGTMGEGIFTPHPASPPIPVGFPVMT